MVPAVLVPPLWVKVPVPELPTYSLAAERLPPPLGGAVNEGGGGERAQ